MYLKAFLAVIASAVLYFVYKLLSDPLKDVPGPIWARFSRLWLGEQIIKGHMQDTQLDLHKQYGPIVRLAPNHYSLNDLDAARQIYGHGAKFAKSDFYFAFGRIEDGHAGVFNEQNIKEHAQKRKRVAQLYSLTSLLSYEPFIDTNNDLLVSSLSRMAREGKAFTVTDWMQYYAFDVIGAITVGQPFGFLSHGSDFQGILYEIHAQARYGTLVGSCWSKIHRYIVKAAPYIGFTVPRVETQKYIVKNIKSKREKMAEGETTEGSTGQQDILEKLFALKDKGKVSELDIENAVGSNINAGSDTTAVTLSAILYFLIRNPSAMEKLRAEIAYAKEAGEVSSPITFHEAQNLTYLQAVIKESLRLHPAVGISLPRLVPEGGATFAGKYFPAGTEVGINSWVLHHNKEAFGPDADEFHPERWMESKERSNEMEHYFLSFGGGSRMCLGKNISMLEINKVVPELVTKFDFELELPKEEWKLKNILFVLQEYRCFVKERVVV